MVVSGVMTLKQKGHVAVNHRTVTGIRAVALGTCACLGVGLVGCASSEATRPAASALDAAESGDVVLGATDDPVQQRLVSSYESELSSAGSSVEVRDVTADDRVPELLSGELTMMIGCVGELLDELDPVKGDELREMYAEAQDAEADGGEAVDASQWRDITHSTMYSALPTELQTSDPGEAVGCKDESLPQNIVAVYRKGDLDRSDRKALNNVAGGLTSDEIASEDD